MTVHSKRMFLSGKELSVNKNKDLCHSHVFLFKIIKLTITKPVRYVDDYFNEYGQSFFDVSSLKFYYTVDI